MHDTMFGGMNSPILTSTSYRHIDEGILPYPRYLNAPNQVALAKKLTALEKGEDALVLASGMAAISTVFMALLKKGDHVILQKSLYGGTQAFVTSQLERYGIDFTIANGDTTDDLHKACTKNTKLIHIETPSNPLLKITDIGAVADFARSRHILTSIDNTFATPINQNPLAFGIDIVIHSATKYMGGHSDITAGAIISSKELIQQFHKTASQFGAPLDPQACYLLERSLKTLALRVERHNTNAMTVARFLVQHPLVDNVYYPGLPSHPNHDIAAWQMHGFGGMMSFEPVASILPKKLLENLQVIAPGVSLAGVESLACLPRYTSHKLLSAEERAEAGIADSLIRLSVGIEDVEDLVEDLDNALKSAQAV
jgi:cystathionine beta-lyase